MFTNWAGNLRYSAAHMHSPATIEEVQELVSSAARAKAIGTRHSFSDIADSEGHLISMDRLTGFEIDAGQRKVTVGPGVRYGELGRALNELGFGLPNLASLPHISVIGACATGTHGSGDRNGNLATSVSALEIVRADGSLKTLTRERERDTFLGAVVGLGALGVVVRVTLDLIPMFQVRQTVYEGLPLDTLETHFDEVTGAGYSVSLFTNWASPSINLVWVKAVDHSLPEALFGATKAAQRRHPVPGMPTENCTEQLGIPGSWDERLPHFRLEFVPSAGDELQTEYFVARENAIAAIRSIQEIGDRITPHLHVSEIRTIAADEVWMSPCYRRDSVAIHFTWMRDWTNVSKLLPVIEERLAPYSPRPHWAKLFTIEPERLACLYPRSADFRQLAREMDPDGKFSNHFLAGMLTER